MLSNGMTAKLCKRYLHKLYAMCDFKSKCATTPRHAEEADRLTKHLLPLHTVEATDSSTPLRSAQNDSALMTSDLEVTHDVKLY